jgi:hypothetical protein
MRDVVNPRKGNTASNTSEKLHPLVKAKTRPDTVIENARMMVPIFSPSAFYMLAHSLLSLAESSLGLIVSNQELSYLKMASRYLVRVFLTTRSLNRSRSEYMIKDVIQIPTPTQEKIRDIRLMVLSVLSTLLVGLKESMTSPIKNTNEGMPVPVIAALIQPTYIRSLSFDDAN